MESCYHIDGWHPGSSADYDALALLLIQSQFTYRSPACPTTITLLSSGMSHLYWGNGRVLCALVANTSVPVADLLLCACANPGLNSTRGLKELEEVLAAGGACWLRILNSRTWLLRPLVDTYPYVDTIVFYERDNSPLASMPLQDGITQSDIALNNLDAVMQLDARCFIPIWQASRIELTNWLSSASYAYLLYADEIPFAYILAGQRERQGQIYRLAVSPEHQGQGFGRYLMAYAIRQMLAARARTINLNTQASNYRSRSLYESLGFQLTGKTVSVYAKKLV